MSDAEAWKDFWATNARGQQGGCLPQRWAAIEQAQRGCWHSFISDLPQGAGVLDLATGDGRVLGWMQAARPDLVLTGIDLAPDLPTPPEGTTTRGGIGMENLPFQNSMFGVVVSQFGFEYGDVVSTAAEIARVLEPGGKVGLMVHRGDGPILEHNLARRAAIDWVLTEQQLCTILRTALQSPVGGPQAAAQVAGAIGLLGSRKFGEDSPAWEIPEALRRAILMGAGAGNDAIFGVIAEIEARAGNEIGRIASLERACGVADGRDGIIAAFADQGLTPRDSHDVCEPSGRALATFLTFS
ncbi:MAG: class I SAM-dependent methyltransferase [Erythrobacter sp.]|nr:class I SAM-dependent methyltransferase [Erythrobacter sp.]